MNNGTPIYVPIHAPEFNGRTEVDATEWKLDIKELEKKISKKTKIIMLNTPHNPIGKIFSPQELIEIGNLAEKYNLLIISDEVYDRLYFNPVKHERIANLNNFWERTLTVGSAGKTFGVTGWRVGWVIGPKHLINYVVGAHTRVCFTTVTPLQEGIAKSFEIAETNAFFDTQIKEYQERKEILLNGLRQVGLKFTIPNGSYFILVETSNLHIPKEDLNTIPEDIKERGQGYIMGYWIAKTVGITIIPVSEFYSSSNSHLGSSFIRLAFCKPLDVLEEACKRLMGLKPYIKNQ